MQACNSLAVATGIEKDPKVVAEVQRHGGPRDLHSLVKACLRQEGRANDTAIDNMSSYELAEQAMRFARMSGLGTSDLPFILADTINKSFMGGYTEAPVTYHLWTKAVENRDFRPRSMVNMSSFGEIDNIPEGAAFKHGVFSDKREQIAIDTKGKAVTITRQAIVNNDTSAISLVPRLAANAIQRRINKDVYDLLTANALVGPNLLETGGPLFVLNRNMLTVGQTAPSVAGIAALERLLLEARLLDASPDAPAAYSGVPAKYLITGTINRISTMQVLSSVFDPAQLVANQVGNPFNNVLTPVFDPYLQSRLTAAGRANGWYLATDYNQLPHISVAFLEGQKVPSIRAEASRVGYPLGISWDFYFDWGVGAEDHRGIAFSDGDA